jgi:hypothetical protein
MRKRTLMIVGLGELGGIVLEYLARIPNLGCRIVTADINEEAGLRKRNSALQGASYFGLYPEIEFKKMDLANLDGSAALLKAVAPDVIFNATTLASWWVVGLLPKDVHERLYTLGAGGGSWTAPHVPLSYKLMSAVREAGIAPLVVNGSYPDVVNPILAKVGLAPTVGIGNLDLAVPPLRQTLATKFDVPLRDVEVYLVGHHFHSYNITRHGNTKGVPFFLKACIGGIDVTDQLRVDDLLKDVVQVARRPDGAASTYVTAGSASKNILALLTDSRERTHAPGPNGLPGGYPVRLSASGAEVALPSGLTLEAAVRINEAGQRAEGVERIEDDGTVVFTDTTYAVIKEIVGFECRRLPLKDCEEIARELGQKLSELGHRYGLSLQVHRTV